MLSDTIANFYMSLYKFNPTIAGGFIGAIAQVLVIFGIHWGLFLLSSQYREIWI